MTAILLAVQFIVTIAMVGTILLQRSEGGALGLGGGGGVSGLMSGRGAANALSRTTVILAAIFIATSLALAMIAKANSRGGSITLPATSQPAAPATPGQTPAPTGPAAPTPSGSAPTGSAPATTAPAVPAVPVPSTPTPAPVTPTPGSTAPAAPSGGGH
ncbi:MAG: preprotein translocase subunit SecG [Alphaproteobacteria bacterium]|nr:preprotein translocase subunit SecG [Alphaproteobacteria bacterium]